MSSNKRAVDSQDSHDRSSGTPRSSGQVAPDHTRNTSHRGREASQRKSRDGSKILSQHLRNSASPNKHAANIRAGSTSGQKSRPRPGSRSPKKHSASIRMGSLSGQKLRSRSSSQSPRKNARKTPHRRHINDLNASPSAGRGQSASRRAIGPSGQEGITATTRKLQLPKEVDSDGEMRRAVADRVMSHWASKVSSIIHFLPTAYYGFC